jgi:Ser/Thr protein kinase RdoA (MazF antagonist)
MAAPRAAGRRISWEQVPGHVRRAVEAALGAAVLEAQTQKGGFSPGAAARLRLSNGSAAFVKALGVDLDRDSVGLYRNEAATMPHLPAGLPVPRLLDVYDDGEWVALVYEEIRGRQPAVPWQADELERVAGAVNDLSTALRPSPWPDAPGFAEANSTLLRVWRELAAAPPPDLDPWLRRQLEQLGAQEIDMAEFVRGDGLLHTDIRSDNLLLTLDGGVIFLDWAWTCNGAPWLDLLLFAMTVNAEGGADAELLVRGHPLTRDITPSWIDAVLLAVAGNYWWVSRSPEPPSLPGIRAYQEAYADATLRWVRRRVAR